MTGRHVHHRTRADRVLERVVGPVMFAGTYAFLLIALGVTG